MLVAALLVALVAAAPEVRTNVPAGAVLDPQAPIAISWTSRPPGRVLVLLGEADWSDLFEPTATGLALETRLVPLPLGNLELRVLQVAEEDGAPAELLRVAFRVEAARPRRIGLDITARRQFAESHLPSDFRPPSSSTRNQLGTFGAWSGQASYDAARRMPGGEGRFRVRVVGASLDPERLRFRSEGAEAPAVDLASWSAELGNKRTKLLLGELALPEARHLLDAGRNRGLQLAVLRPRFDVRLLGTSGTALVGWDDPLGIARPEHRLLGGVLGVEVLPTAGALRLELAALDGALAPLPGVNRGAVQDAEASRGIETHLRGGLFAQRVRVDGSWARSRWSKRADPELEGGLDLEALPVAEKDARFASVELDVLRGVPVLGRALTLGAQATHERIDPLYRSVASQARGDLLQELGGLSLALDALTVVAQHTRLRDNLDAVTSILTTRTRRTTVTVAAPAQALLPNGSTPRWFLPALTYAFDRTLQRGDGIPDGSDFTPSQVPDQLSRSHAATATWVHGPATVTYSFSAALQDNRQPTRELADFTTRAHALGATLARGTELSVGLELGLDRSVNHEEPRTETQRRVAVNGTWQRAVGLTLQGSMALVRSSDAAGTSSSRTLEADGQLGWRRALRRGHLRPSSLVFVRASTQRARQQALALDVDRRAWQMATGITFSAF